MTDQPSYPENPTDLQRTAYLHMLAYLVDLGVDHIERHSTRGPALTAWRVRRGVNCLLHFFADDPDTYRPAVDALVHAWRDERE